VNTTFVMAPVSIPHAIRFAESLPSDGWYLFPDPISTMIRSFPLRIIGIVVLDSTSPAFVSPVQPEFSARSFEVPSGRRYRSARDEAVAHDGYFELALNEAVLFWAETVLDASGVMADAESLV